MTETEKLEAISGILDAFITTGQLAQLLGAANAETLGPIAMEAMEYIAGVLEGKSPFTGADESE